MSFSRFRSRFAKPRHDHSASCSNGAGAHDHEQSNEPAHDLHLDSATEQTADVPSGYIRSQLRIVQMDCPTEERLIRDKLARNPHVSALHFNLLERRLQVHHAPGQQQSVITDIAALGMQAMPLLSGAEAASDEGGGNKRYFW